MYDRSIITNVQEDKRPTDDIQVGDTSNSDKDPNRGGEELFVLELEKSVIKIVLQDPELLLSTTALRVSCSLDLFHDVLSLLIPRRCEETRTRLIISRRCDFNILSLLDAPSPKGAPSPSHHFSTLPVPKVRLHHLIISRRSQSQRCDFTILSFLDAPSCWRRCRRSTRGQCSLVVRGTGSSVTLRPTFPKKDSYQQHSSC